ncbi:phospholipase A2 [Nonomuraea basaltis]|uniref:phospholipase A2 n=1 Tax=Nonomuraea basaltis TaxID=2495887 RepID=UPI00110C4AD9|nr:phospholipase A2 [Nonomuraea basaltis]TMR96801.1 phospholipase [Nonomuraea basaltis]
MRRLTLAAAVAAVLLPLLAAPAAAAETVEEAPTVPVQEIGPGLYFPESNTYELHEVDVAAGAIGRRHDVTVVDSGLAKPETAPESRPELGVFGPGWQAEILGGTITRKLEVQSDAVVVTELDGGTSTRYALTSSVSFPSGGGVQKYEATDGSKITETTKWDASAGELRTTIVETLKTSTDTDEGDDTFANDSGAALSAAELTPTYTWTRLGALQGDNWRVAGFGTSAYGTTSLTYDSAGRISTVKEPAVGEKPEETVTLHYATTTTATSGSFGDYAGQVKEITLVSGSEAPKTVADFDYDLSGWLRSTSDPSSGTQEETYAYDAAGRLSEIDSLDLGAWDVSFPADSAAPVVTNTEPDRPSATDALAGPAGTFDPNDTEPDPADFPNPDIDGILSSPSYCSTVRNWMWYTKYGCATKVAHNGWHNPYFKNTPTGFRVVGINYDHCTSAPDQPRWNLFYKFDYRVACDMHDYGYGLIGNTYKGYRWYLDRNQEKNVDNLFFTTLVSKTCPKYIILSRPSCLRWAVIYRVGVSLGKPKNGADRT